MYTNFVQALMSLFLRSQLCRCARSPKSTHDYRDIATRFSTFATGVVDTGGAPWLANTEYLREFSILFELTQLLFSGAWMIHEKNLMALSL